MVEPVQSRRPDFRPRQFLEAVRELTAKSRNRSSSCDEIVTGFGVMYRAARKGLVGTAPILSLTHKVVRGWQPIGILPARPRSWMLSMAGFWQ